MAYPTRGELLEGPFLYLRRTNEETESPIIENWLRNSQTSLFLNVEDPFPVQREYELPRISNIAQRLATQDLNTDYAKRPVDLAFSVLSQKNNELVGMILLHVSLLHKVGTVRTVIAPEHQRKGFGREAKRLVLEHAFLHLELVKVCSQMLENNAGNRKVNDFLGFRLEGKLRNHVEIKGRRYDLYLMAILREKWLRRRHLYL